MHLDEDGKADDEWAVTGGGGTKPELEAWVPLSVREARRARERRDELWSYVWINFASMIILVISLAIVCYRMGGQK
jgi:hypothetical protein